MFRRSGYTTQNGSLVDLSPQRLSTKILLDRTTGLPDELLQRILSSEANVFLTAARQNRSLSSSGSMHYAAQRKTRLAYYRYVSNSGNDFLQVVPSEYLVKLLREIVRLQELNVCFFIDFVDVSQEFGYSLTEHIVDLTVVSWPDTLPPSLNQSSWYAYSADPNASSWIPADYRIVYPPEEKRVEFTDVRSIAGPTVTVSGETLQCGTSHRFLMNMTVAEHDRFFAQDGVEVTYSQPDGTPPESWERFYVPLLSYPEAFTLHEAPRETWLRINPFGYFGVGVAVRSKTYISAEKMQEVYPDYTPPNLLQQNDAFSVRGIVIVGHRGLNDKFYPLAKGHASIVSTHCVEWNADHTRVYNFFETYPITYPPASIMYAGAAQAMADTDIKTLMGAGERIKTIPFRAYTIYQPES